MKIYCDILPHGSRFVYQRDVTWLRRVVLDIQEAVTVPKRRMGVGGG